jgi:hypothetical protein
LHQGGHDVVGVQLRLERSNADAVVVPQWAVAAGDMYGRIPILQLR